MWPLAYARPSGACSIHIVILKVRANTVAMPSGLLDQLFKDRLDRRIVHWFFLRLCRNPARDVESVRRMCVTFSWLRVSV